MLAAWYSFCAGKLRVFKVKAVDSYRIGCCHVPFTYSLQDKTMPDVVYMQQAESAMFECLMPMSTVPAKRCCHQCFQAALSGGA